MKIEDFDFPDELYYDRHHFWIKDEGDVISMGVTDYAQNLAGDFIVVELPDEGMKIKADKPFASLESSKWVGRIYAPLNGVVVEVNEEVDDDSTLLNSSPYGDGWICKIKPDNKDDLKQLSKASDEDFIAWIKKEIEEHAKEE